MTRTDPQWEDAQYRRFFSADERKTLAKKGHAMADGSFPITDRESLEDAIRLAGHAHDPQAARRFIRKRAGDLGLASLIPSTWSESRSVEDDDVYRRSLAAIETVRAPTGEDATGDGSYTFDGVLLPYGQPAVVHDRSTYRIVESFEPGSFDHLLDQPVSLLYEHDRSYPPLARTGITGVGGLELRSTSRGVHAFARLDGNVGYVRDIAQQIKNGVIHQMSVGFQVGKDGRHVETRTLPDGREEDHVHITRAKRIIDASVTDRGVYGDATSAMIRSGRDPYGSGYDFLVARRSVAGGEITVAPSVEGGIEVERARALAHLRLRAFHLKGVAK